jgi:hypothetical protein
MSTVENALSEHIVGENFGETSLSIMKMLNKKKSYTFGQLKDDLKLDKKIVSFGSFFV